MKHSYGTNFIPIIIVHSSAMYYMYHNFNVIRKGSKKLSTIQNSNSFF